MSGRTQQRYVIIWHKLLRKLRARIEHLRVPTALAAECDSQSGPIFFPTLESLTPACVGIQTLVANGDAARTRPCRSAKYESAADVKYAVDGGHGEGVSLFTRFI